MNYIEDNPKYPLIITVYLQHLLDRYKYLLYSMGYCLNNYVLPVIIISDRLICFTRCGTFNTH